VTYYAATAYEVTAYDGRENVQNISTHCIDATYWYKLALLRPRNFHRHRSGWLPPNQHRQVRHRGFLQCSRRSFWALFPETAPHLRRTV